MLGDYQRYARPALTGVAVGLVIAFVNALVNVGDVSWLSWILIPAVVAALLCWLTADHSSNSSPG